MNSINIIKQLIPGLKNNETWVQWFKAFVGGMYEDTVERTFKITNRKVGPHRYTVIYVTNEITESLGLNLSIDNVVNLDCYAQGQWQSIHPAEFNLTANGIITMKLVSPVLFDWKTGSIQKIRLSYKVVQTVLPRQFEVQWPHYIKTLSGHGVLNKLSSLASAVRLLRNCLRRDILQSEQQVDRRVVLTKDGAGVIYNPIRYLGYKWFVTTGYVSISDGRLEVVVNDVLPPNIVLGCNNCIIAETESHIWDDGIDKIICEVTSVTNNCAYGLGTDTFEIHPDFKYAVAFRYPSVMLHESDYVDYRKVSDDLYSNDPNNILGQLIEQKPAWKGYTVESLVRQTGVVNNVWKIPAFGYSSDSSHKIKLEIPSDRIHDEYVVEYNSDVIASASVIDGYLHISSYSWRFVDVEKVELTIRNTTTGGSVNITTYWCPSQDVPQGVMTTPDGDIQLYPFIFGDFIEVPLVKETPVSVTAEKITIKIPFNEVSITAKYNQYTMELLSPESLSVEDAEWRVIDGQYYLWASIIVNTVGESLLRVVSTDTGVGKDFLIRVTQNDETQVQASRVYISGTSLTVPVNVNRGWKIKSVESSNELLKVSYDLTGIKCAVDSDFVEDDITSEVTVTFMDSSGSDYVEKFVAIKPSAIPRGAYKAEFSKYGALQANNLGLVVQSPAFFILQPGAAISLDLSHLESFTSTHEVSNHKIDVNSFGSKVVVSARDDGKSDLAIANVGIGTERSQRFLKFYSLGTPDTRPAVKISTSVVPQGSASVTVKGNSTVLHEGDIVTVSVTPMAGYDVTAVEINSYIMDPTAKIYNVTLGQENIISVTTAEQSNPPVFCSFSTTNFEFTAIEVDSEGATIRTRYVGKNFGESFNYGTRMRIVPKGVSQSSAEFAGWYYNDGTTAMWTPVPGQIEGSQELNVVLTEPRNYRCFWLILDKERL